MYFSADRLALANKAVKETFAHTSVAWQVIPHWETGDPSQTQVPNDSLTAFNFIPLAPLPIDFTVTVAQAIAPKPDMLLTLVVANTVKLATAFDNKVFPGLRPGAQEVHIPATWPPAAVLKHLIDARVLVEQGGYRAPSCLVVTTDGLHKITKLTTTLIPESQVVLPPAHISSLHRVDQLEDPVADVKAYLLGRRQRIPAGGAADASPGEEAVDIAVSVPPSLEVVGDNAGVIQLRVRITFALRVKDLHGFVAVRTP
jgi:hypothetical protein